MLRTGLVFPEESFPLKQTGEIPWKTLISIQYIYIFVFLSEGGAFTLLLAEFPWDRQ